MTVLAAGQRAAHFDTYQERTITTSKSRRRFFNEHMYDLFTNTFEVFYSTFKKINMVAISEMKVK